MGGGRHKQPFGGAHLSFSPLPPPLATALGSDQCEARHGYVGCQWVVAPPAYNLLFVYGASWESKITLKMKPNQVRKPFPLNLRPVNFASMTNCIKLHCIILKELHFCPFYCIFTFKEKLGFNKKFLTSWLLFTISLFVLVSSSNNMIFLACDCNFANNSVEKLQRDCVTIKSTVAIKNKQFSHIW